MVTSVGLLYVYRRSVTNSREILGPARTGYFCTEQEFGVKTKCITADFTRGLEIYECVNDGLDGLDIAVLGKPYYSVKRQSI